MMLRPLQEGDRIALVAPASHFDTALFEKGRQVIEDHGFEVLPGKHAFSRHRYLAGTDAERAEDLIHAFTDSEVSAVLCIRGGYGSGRLLNRLPFSTLKRHFKPFVGFSDITFLHLAFHSRMQWVTFHGPNLRDIAQDSIHGTVVLNALCGRNAFTWDLEQARILKPGTATGTALGGNLTCLGHLLGTPFFPDLSGALLFIEDRGEALYRLDRLLTQLRLSGNLQKLGGLVLGQFENCAESERIFDMVLDQVKAFAFPVVGDLPFGHGSRNQVIPLGIPYYLSTYERTLKPNRHPFSR